MTEPDSPSLAEVVQEVAGEHLGVERWDRPAIYRDTVAAASDTGLSYWAVLTLSGAIATLGLALNSSAVVIGAMLVAPLLAPMVGLALALAMGDGRLAARTGLVVVGSSAAVIAASAVLTALLPFHEITLEISARTRPTTLDLAVAIFSGLVGAVVTVGRGTRLSAAIPGVAIAVALIPPLAVAGFGVGIGGNTELIFGALLLYGANLAGIVLSGMAVFLLVGMHRPEVCEIAREWHTSENDGLGRWMGRVPGVQRLGALPATWARLGLVGGFVVALGFPLTASLREISREVRVDRAISEAAANFESPGVASILDRQVSIGRAATEVRLRVATTQWFAAEDIEAFELAASTLAGEPVRLQLEQLPTTAGDLDQLAELFPQRVAPAPPPAPVRPELPALVTDLANRLAQVVPNLTLPAGVVLSHLELAASVTGDVTLRGAYQSDEPLSPDAEEMLAAQLRRALDFPTLTVELQHVEAEAEPEVD